MRRNVAKAIAAALLSLPPAWPQHDHDDKPETFESILNLVIRSSRERLRPLKTFRIEQRPSTEYWYEVTDSLPGAECRIYEHPRMVYQCTWAASKKNGGPADAAGLLAEIEKAVPEKYDAKNEKGNILLEPRDGARYPPMEIVGARSTKAGLQLRIYPTRRE